MKGESFSAVLHALALHSHKTHFSLNITCTHFLQSALHQRPAAFTTCPEERESEWGELSAKRGVCKTGKEVQSSSEWVCVSEWVSDWEKVRVGWPCYQLGWVGQAGRRLLSMGRDRQMLALLPGQNISPGAGSTQSGPGSCNPNDHWWRCTWPTDQLHTHWALPLPFPPTPRPSVSSLTSNTSQLSVETRCAHKAQKKQGGELE